MDIEAKTQEKKISHELCRTRAQYDFAIQNYAGHEFCIIHDLFLFLENENFLYRIVPLVKTFCGLHTVLITFPSPHNLVSSSGVIRLTIFGLVSIFGVDAFAIIIPTGFCLTSPFLP